MGSLYQDDTPPIDWGALTTEEQNTLIRLGYVPPKGTLLRGNMDLEIQDGPTNCGSACPHGRT